MEAARQAAGSKPLFVDEAATEKAGMGHDEYMTHLRGLGEVCEEACRSRLRLRCGVREVALADDLELQ